MSAPDPLGSALAELAEIDRIARKGFTILNSERDDLDLVRRKVRLLVDELTAAGSASAAVTAATTKFTTWKTDDVGAFVWPHYLAIKEKYAERKSAPPSAPADDTWSAECDQVWADMQARYQAWNGSQATRGHWWNGPATGGAGGAARSVPDSVLTELKRRIPKERPSGVASWWEFSDSWVGGLSFHRTRGTVDFIYHMQL